MAEDKKQDGLDAGAALANLEAESAGEDIEQITGMTDEDGNVHVGTLTAAQLFGMIMEQCHNNKAEYQDLIMTLETIKVRFRVFPLEVMAIEGMDRVH
jgi:hypothetical protein